LTSRAIAVGFLKPIPWAGNFICANKQPRLITSNSELHLKVRQAPCCHKVSLLQKHFVASTVKLFFVSVSSVDTILRIKNKSFLYRLFPHPKLFFKNKKNRSPGHIGALLTDIHRDRRGRTLLPDLLGPSRGPPSSSGSASTTAQLEQWGLLSDESSESASIASSSGSSGALSPQPSCTPADHHLRLA
jgi:hypothetical protein